MNSPPPSAAVPPDFRDRLRDELVRRRAVNRRYSVRAFADFLGTDHSTLSQILRGRRPVPATSLRGWALRLRLGSEETELYCAAIAGEDLASFEKRQRHMNWMTEAAALLSRPAHWQLLQLLRAPDWRPDTRWIAARIGTHVDDINDALARLLRLGLLETGADGSWRDCSGVEELNAQRLLECALARLRSSMSAR
jgi:transcriptional regulator with XRE-family HTH domain